MKWERKQEQIKKEKPNTYNHQRYPATTRKTPHSLSGLSRRGKKEYILHLPLQLPPLRTSVPFRAFHVIRAGVDEPAGFVGELAQVRRFDEALEVQAIGFLNAF